MALKNQALHPYMAKKGPFTIEVPGVQKKEGETIPRRHPSARDGLITTPDPNVHTVYDLVRRSAEKFGNAKALGTRKLVKTHQETKMVKKMVDGQQQEVEKKWTYFELSEYSYLSFVQYEKMVLQVSSGLRKLGLSKGDRLHIFAATSAHWLAMSHGAGFQTMPIATAYDTLGVEGLRHSLVQTRAKAVYCDPAVMKTLGDALDKAKDVKFIIYNDHGEIDQSLISKLTSENEGLQLLSFEELRKLGEDNPVDPVPPTPEDLFGIMYTSGSTGTPKGVPIKHKAVVAAVAGVTTIVGPYIGPGDGLLTYLPLAHILEFVFENACLYWGGTMGYGNARTLSDNSVRHCKGDIREFKPSIMVGVPQVWETVRKGIVAQVDSGSAIVQNLFWGAMRAKSFLMSYGLPGSFLLDAVVFKKIKAATGGRLKLCMNGGGPISKETQQFISMAIAPMIGGYGLTETSCMGALCDPMHWTTQALGDIPSSVEVKLVDFAEANYFSTNKPPQGEVWIRGAPVAEQYYENEEETKAAMTEDGWFKTGDIGEFDSNGQLRLIDRKKNLVKTLNGEYIALEKLESVYKSARVVANICVYATGEHTKPIAIIVPAEPALKKLAEQHGVEGGTVEELSQSTKLRSAVLKELQAAGKSGGLGSSEMLHGVVLADEEWTPQNGFTTAAQKIQRRPILKKYQEEVDRAFSGS